MTTRDMAAEPRTRTGRSLNDMPRLHVADCLKSQRRSNTACTCNVAGDILAIEAEAAAPGPALTRTEVRRVITDAYYGARNEGETMEMAADRAADAVMALAPAAAEEEPTDD